MRLIVNGEEKESGDSTTLAQFIEQMGIKGDRVAVELNREIVPRAQWPEMRLHDGDRLEIVHFVGGGTGPDGTSGFLIFSSSKADSCF